MLGCDSTVTGPASNLRPLVHRSYRNSRGAHHSTSALDSFFAGLSIGDANANGPTVLPAGVHGHAPTRELYPADTAVRTDGRSQNCTYCTYDSYQASQSDESQVAVDAQELLGLFLSTRMPKRKSMPVAAWRFSFETKPDANTAPERFRQWEAEHHPGRTKLDSQ